MLMTVVSMRKTSTCFSHVVIELFLIQHARYGAVVRGQNAYVPPGARKTGAGPTAAENVTSAKGDVPKVSVNGPDGTSVPAQTQSPPSSKATSPAPPASGSASNLNKVNLVSRVM
jgi:hypothetical protein